MTPKVKVLFVKFYKDTGITRQDRGPEVGGKAFQVVISGRQDIFEVKYGVPHHKALAFKDDVKLNWADVIFGVGKPESIPKMYRHKILHLGNAPVNKNHWGISNNEKNFNEMYGEICMGFACLSPAHRRYIIDKTNLGVSRLPIISYPLHPLQIV